MDSSARRGRALTGLGQHFFDKAQFHSWIGSRLKGFGYGGVENRTPRTVARGNANVRNVDVDYDLADRDYDGGDLTDDLITPTFSRETALPVRAAADNRVAWRAATPSPPRVETSSTVSIATAEDTKPEPSPDLSPAPKPSETPGHFAENPAENPAEHSAEHPSEQHYHL